MLKKFYITRTTGDQAEGVNVPGLDKYQRVEQLNNMLRLGWVIKDYKESESESYFLLERA
ncbi:MAG: hypothetical protein IJ696_04615 [Ruminococcus sp.]|nr:hypothetical protein [Ruminococcus sp.]